MSLRNGLIFNTGENAIGYFINSSANKAQIKSGINQPEILSELKLYVDSDVRRKGGNIVYESSPARLNNNLFLAVG